MNAHPARLRLLLTARVRRVITGALLATAFATAAHAEFVFKDGFEPLAAAPVVQIERDDRVATLSMDYDGENAWGQWWTMDGSGHDDAGFLVTWWPEGISPEKIQLGRPSPHHDGDLGCLAKSDASVDAATDVHWLVTGNRRVQLQPLVNAASYHVRVQRIDALGEITSLPTDVTFDGGDATRVDALRASMIVPADVVPDTAVTIVTEPDSPAASVDLLHTTTGPGALQSQPVPLALTKLIESGRFKTIRGSDTASRPVLL